MPRRPTGEKLDKVISTKIPFSDLQLLEEYARLEYNRRHIPQPTISMLLRLIIARWAESVEKKKTSQIEWDTDYMARKPRIESNSHNLSK
jgi:hypothetical protein